jgi:putative AbiEi antitoxin of type IV toxin-antitoxin system/uncharacterized protein DUF559
MPGLDDDLARLATRQHGLVTVQQARDAGATRSALRRRIEAGSWRVADRGVLRVGGAPVTWESDLLARVLSAGPGAVASHRSAAVLWDLEGCRPGVPELSIPNGRRYRRANVRMHESTDLDLVKPVRRRGIPTTAVARTLLDLGGVVDRNRVHVALDDARRRRLTDWDTLLETLTSHARRGRNGVGTLRAILEDHYGELEVTDSGFERLVTALLLGAGLPRPVLHHEVIVRGACCHVDLAYPDALVAIELDGRDHLRPEVFETDRPRQNGVVLAGWTVLRFTWKQYRHRPHEIVADVRAALA